MDGCGFTGYPITGALDTCTEPIDPEAPDLRGYWRNTDTGEIDELIEQCGSRWIDISKPVIHDFIQCTGVYGDGLGCQDYNGPIISSQGGECSPIMVMCKFEKEEDSDNKCVNLYAPASAVVGGDGQGEVRKVVSRCLQADGTMVWKHPLFGTVTYERVDSPDEPNCMICADAGVSTSDVDDVLPCSYDEREWVQCDELQEGDAADSPVASPGNQTLSPSNGGLDRLGTMSGAFAVVVAYVMQ